jgi:prepilin-type N-terminal cleavage/methylation domain-containing protein/prepilin-type processing-associated H-X9-DG protein
VDHVRQRPNKAFTLIELLVVIAIIALLIGILLPALGTARKAGRGTVNLANLRSLGQASEMYLSDYNTLPPFRLPPGQVHPATGRPQARWQWFLGDYVGQPFHPMNDAEYQAFLNNDDLPRYDNKVFQDPSHRPEHFRNSSGAIQAERNGSYGYNYHYLGNNRFEGPNGRPANFPMRVVRINQPSLTVSIGDSLGNQATYLSRNTREHSYTLDPPRLDTAGSGATSFAQSSGMSPAEARNGSKATMSFLDGHAKVLSLQELGYIVADEKKNQVVHNRGNNSLFNGLGHDPGATQ